MSGVQSALGTQAADPPVWPAFAEDELEAVRTVLSSGRVNYWTGEQCRLFEQEFARFCGVRFGVAMSNGTAALETALSILDVGRGDEVVVTPRTFFASASAIATRGAIPVFADVDRESQNVSAESVARVLSPATRAVVLVHLAGWPCDMDSILTLARERNLAVIEDCAQAHGATYRGRRVGSFGDVAAFSFCQDKIMTTGGEGGMLLTNDEVLRDKAWSLKDHGKSRHALEAPSGPVAFRWLHDSFGTNLRMTEMQAAIGRKQLEKLPAWLTRRRSNADVLTWRLKELPALRVTEPPGHVGHAYYKYYAFVRPERLRAGWNRDRILAAVNDAGVPCFAGSCGEVYRERAFGRCGLGPDRPLPTARELGETSLMFQVHPTLQSHHMERMAGVIADVVERSTA